MSMTPLIPLLKPSISRCLNARKKPINHEAIILKCERDHHKWLESIKNAGVNIQPLGKSLNKNGYDIDDEDANDDSDETETHEDDDEDTNDHLAPEMVVESPLYSPHGELNATNELSVSINSEFH